MVYFHTLAGTWWTVPHKGRTRGCHLKKLCAFVKTSPVSSNTRRTSATTTSADTFQTNGSSRHQRCRLASCLHHRHHPRLPRRDGPLPRPMRVEVSGSPPFRKKCRPTKHHYQRGKRKDDGNARATSALLHCPGHTWADAPRKLNKIKSRKRKVCIASRTISSLVYTRNKVGSAKCEVRPHGIGQKGHLTPVLVEQDLLVSQACVLEKSCLVPPRVAR